MTNQLRTGRTTSSGSGPNGEPVIDNEYLTYDAVELRIAKLKDVQQDLAAAVLAIKALEFDGELRKREYDELVASIRDLQEDKKAAELLLGVPENSFGRLLDRATRRGRWRGRVDGFLMGVLSSLLAWYISLALPQLPVPHSVVKPQASQSAKT